jgi:acetamidase/formamidase
MLESRRFRHRCRCLRLDAEVIPREDIMKRLLTITAIVALGVGAGFYAVAQQPYQLTPMEEAKRERAVSAGGGTYHVLPATLDTTQWGWLDPNEKPKLVVNSGDTVAVETMMHAHNAIQPGSTMDDIVKLRLANPGGGPHSVTGPIYVNGAEPGDTMEIRIKKIVPKAFGTNFHLPGSQFPTVGQLAPEFAQGFVRYYYLDWDKRQTEFKPGITIDLQPFPGTFAVGVDPNEPAPKAGPPIKDAKGRTSTLRPWKNGSNMDLNELQEGSTLYIPIFLKGGLIWTGDSHCRQGNGEVNLTALECAYREIVIQPVVRKDLKIEWPRAETASHFILMGFDEDLNEAMKIAVRETVKFLSEQKMVPMSRDEAYALTSMVGDCRVTQVVDVRKGVHCMVPKNIFVKK